MLDLSMKHALPFDALLHQELLSGKRKAIAWGVAGNLYYHVLQSPYPFIAIIDGLNGPQVGQVLFDIPIVGPNVLDNYPVEEIVIVIFSDLQQFGGQIIEQLAHYGDYPYITPYVEATCQPSEILQQKLERLIRDRRTHRLPQVVQRVVLYIQFLVKGGAERQMVLLAIGLRQLGWEVHLISVKNKELEVNHWEALLRTHGVELYFVPSARECWPNLQLEENSYPLANQLAPFFEPGLLHCILTAYRYMQRVQPKLVIAYLEDGNVIASMAAIFAGVEQIIISGRCVAPSEFPEYLAVYDEPRLAAYYRLMTELPGIVLSVNSMAGAQSYARWLNFSESGIPVVKNAVMAKRVEGQVPLQQLGIPLSAKILMGIMRLSPEKSPCRFIEVVSSVLAKQPQAHVILIGDGPLRPEVTACIAQQPCRDRIHLVGVKDNIFEWLSCANLLISTSSHEGMSNVILEAQAIGCPVVATDIPGNRETVLTEFSCDLIPYGEWDLMVEKIVSLLMGNGEKTSVGLVKKMSEHYSPLILAEKTLALTNKQQTGE
ncbi:glycosyltransferase [Aeromonas salmonicida]|uniref:glycosyltransferase n=1 Tax=Aeromonas salmonicida TaxID=645 RepID=UPI00259D7834|nr:glycosyltransferase [Aeromonas salmonicida]MDM5116290.1 glycosyltransferase [Aeromonas salmonicida]